MSLFHIQRFDVRCGFYMEEESVAAKVVDLWAFSEILKHYNPSRIRCIE